MAANKHRSNSVRQLRRGLAKAIAVALIVLLVAVFGEQLPQMQYAALSALLAGAALASLVGLAAAWLYASSYLADREEPSEGLRLLWGYVARAGAWGLAGGGIGALLTTALPSRLASPPTDPSGVPIAGWMAITFGGVGVALGILEEWRSRLPEDTHPPSDSG